MSETEFWEKLKQKESVFQGSLQNVPIRGIGADISEVFEKLTDSTKINYITDIRKGKIGAMAILEADALSPTEEEFVINLLTIYKELSISKNGVGRKQMANIAVGSIERAYEQEVMQPTQQSGLSKLLRGNKE